MRQRNLLLLVPFLLVALALLVATPASAAVSVGGYVKLDIQWSDRILGGGAPSPSPAATPAKSNKEADHDQTKLDARQSRLRADWTDDVAGVKMSGKVEADFFTGDGNALTSNSRHLRLRHAYARADHPSGFFILAGQTWALFMNDTIAQPNLVDFNGPAGQIFARQPQFRAGWKAPMGPMGTLVFEADIEQHSVNDLGATSVNESQGEGQSAPLFTGKVSWLSSLFQAEAAGAFGNNTVTRTGGSQTSEDAWALQASAQTTFSPVTLFAHAQTQKGLGRLLNGDFPGAGLTAANNLENIESNGFYVGASFAVTPDLSLNGVYGWAKGDEKQSIGFTGAALKEHQSIHVNAIQKFWKSWQAGLEFRRFDVKAFNGTKGEVDFLHGALWYFF